MKTSKKSWSDRKLGDDPSISDVDDVRATVAMENKCENIIKEEEVTNEDSVDSDATERKLNQRH